MHNRNDRDIVEREAERQMYERELRRENQVARANASASTGMLIGVFFIAIFGLVAAFFLLNQRQETPVQAPQAPDVNIELPEQPAPEPPQIQAPDININVPEPQLPSTNQPTEPAPAAESAPAGDPTQPAPAQP
ncbi:hypothetical protein IQ268_05590 [Oculatella sp. LEGE 06141]|uniref:hypothetical protein n=1 Tax=Oculatella sp. LEGE 06141 TaxID=1828648 RepID=UPI001881E9C1|nr:hypothetical protein [Oculatella sp. LEGE 06141]MBE9178057.1 hypothetical protein [Oculatella sp. LEGE 06141]